MGDLFQLRQPKHLAKLAKSESDMNYLDIKKWRIQIEVSPEIERIVRSEVWTVVNVV